MSEDQRTVLVTGGTSGIGLELVKILCKNNYRVFTTGRNQKRLDEVCNETGAVGKTCDLSDPSQVLELYKAAVQCLGKVDILVNNAGYSNNNKKEQVKDSSLENFETQYAINLRAPFLLCREAMRDMIKRDEERKQKSQTTSIEKSRANVSSGFKTSETEPFVAGHIVNIVSTVALKRQENFGVYSAMKFGLHGLTGSLQKEGRLNNIKVTAVFPGGTETNIRPRAAPEYMRPASAAFMIYQCISAPSDVIVDHIVYRPMAESD